MKDHHKKTTCRICDSKDLKQFLDLDRTPLANSLVVVSSIICVLNIILIIVLPIILKDIPVITFYRVFFMLSLPLEALMIIYIILSVMVRRFVIRHYRVYAESGIFYKKQKSVVFRKIDNITLYRGFLNNVFNNGSVGISTVGSSGIELFLVNIPNYKEFYEVLKGKYR